MGIGQGHVNEIEMESLLNYILKADAVAKSGNDTRVGTSEWRGGDSEAGAEHDNQPLDNEGLGM